MDIEKLNSENFRSYCHLSTYAINFGLTSPGGGTCGEMTMKWKLIGSARVPRLHCWDDGFAVLSTFNDLLDGLRAFDDSNFTQEEFIKLLEEHHFIDEYSYPSDYITDEMFDEYQNNRKVEARDKSIDKLLNESK